MAKDDIKFVKENSLAAKPITAKDLDKPSVIVGFMKNEKGSGGQQTKGKIIEIKKRGDVYDIYTGDELRPSQQGIPKEEVLRLYSQEATSGYMYKAESKADPKLSRWIDIDDEDIYTNRIVDLDPDEVAKKGLPPLQFIEDKEANKPVAGTTLQDAFDNYKEGNRSSQSIGTMRTAMKQLADAGFPADTLLSDLNSEESIRRLQKWATTEKFKGVSAGAGGFASRVKTLINSGKKVEEPNVLAEYEKLNRNTKNEFGIRLTRADRNLEFPDFDSFNRAIDKTARQIQDKQARAFFLIKMLTGLRNPDIVNIQLGKATEGSEYGSFDPSIKKIYALSNKGVRINYDLGEVVHGILADLATDAEAEGRDTLFTQSEEQIRNKINPVMRKNMDALNIEIYDLNKKQAVPFSIRDLRKNIFDILEEEQGAAAANKVLGHSSSGDVGLKHYKVERTKRKSLSSLQKSQELFTSLYMESIGLDNPQMVFGQEGYGFSNDNFKPSMAFSAGETAPQQQQLADTRVRTAEAQVESSIDQSAESLTKRIKNLETLIDKAGSLQEQAQQLTPQKQPTVPPVLDQTGDDTPLKKSTIDKLKAAGVLDKFSKGLKGAFFIEVGRQFLDAPLDTVGEFAKEAGLETAARIAGLGTAPAAAVPMALAASPAGEGSARFGPGSSDTPLIEETDEDRMARIATEDAGFIPEASRVPEAAPTEEQGFIPRMQISLDDLPPERQAQYK